MRGGFEKGGMSRPQETREGGLRVLPIDSSEVQAMLAIAAYNAAHGTEYDPVDWEHADEEVQQVAMLEWVGDLKEDTPADLFRKYVEMHPDEQIGADESSIATLLAALSSGRTLH